MNTWFARNLEVEHEIPKEPKFGIILGSQLPHSLVFQLETNFTGLAELAARFDSLSP